MDLKVKISALGPQTLKKLEKDLILQAQIAENSNCSLRTVERWIYTNHRSLTLPASLELICKKYKITNRQAFNQ